VVRVDILFALRLAPCALRLASCALRHSLGERPNRRRKWAVNAFALGKPAVRPASLMLICGCRSRRVASARRKSAKCARNERPVRRFMQCESVDSEMPSAAATIARVSFGFREFSRRHDIRAERRPLRDDSPASFFCRRRTITVGHTLCRNSSSPVTIARGVTRLWLRREWGRCFTASRIRQAVLMSSISQTVVVSGVVRGVCQGGQNEAFSEYGVGGAAANLGADFAHGASLR